MSEQRAPYDTAALTDNDFGGILGDVPNLPEGWNYPKRGETFCAQIKSCNGAVVMALQAERDGANRALNTVLQKLRAAIENQPQALPGSPDLVDELIAQRDVAKQRADELQKAFDALHKMHEGAFTDARRLLELFRRQAIRSFIAGAGNAYFGLRGKSLSPTDLEFVANIAEWRFPYVAESFRSNDDIVSEYTALVEKYGGAK